MHLLSLPLLSLLFPCAVLSNPLVYFDGVPAELNDTTPKLGRLACPQISSYNAWATATNTRSGNLTLANDSALTTSSDILTFPTAYLFDPISSKSKRTELEKQSCIEIAQMKLHRQYLSNYNLPRTRLLQPGYHRIYAFSFRCNPGFVAVEVFARSTGGPEIRVSYTQFRHEALGSVMFVLSQPKEVRIRLDWGMYQDRTCEFALFSIDML